MSKSKTPRTDAIDQPTADKALRYAAMRSHARTLERELAAANEVADYCMKKGEQWQQRAESAESRLAQAEREVVERCIAAVKHGLRGDSSESTVARRLAEQAIRALADAGKQP